MTPFKGILSEKGLFRETGKEIKSEGNKVNNFVKELIIGFFLMVVIGWGLFFYFSRKST
jgi:hypothetical protein